jgi:hypothetical protein
LSMLLLLLLLLLLLTTHPQRSRSAAGTGRQPVPTNRRVRPPLLLHWKQCAFRTSSTPLCPARVLLLAVLLLLVVAAVVVLLAASQKQQWHRRLAPAPPCLWHCCSLARSVS